MPHWCGCSLTDDIHFASTGLPVSEIFFLTMNAIKTTLLMSCLLLLLAACSSSPPTLNKMSDYFPRYVFQAHYTDDTWNSIKNVPYDGYVELSGYIENRVIRACLQSVHLSQSNMAAIVTNPR